MNRGPRPHAGKPADAATFVSRLEQQLGGEAPDWLMELARLCDRVGQKKAAVRINYSAAVVSQILRGTYIGDAGRVEEAVRGALMGKTVACPELGEIGRDRCLFIQRKGLSTASPQSVRLYHLCRSGKCPHSTTGSDQ